MGKTLRLGEERGHRWGEWERVSWVGEERQGGWLSKRQESQDQAREACPGPSELAKHSEHGFVSQGHHSMGHFPAGGCGKEEPTIECAVNRFGSYSLSWNFLAFLSSMHHDLAVALHRGVVAVRRCLPCRPRTVQARVAWGGVRPI